MWSVVSANKWIRPTTQWTARRSYWQAVLTKYWDAKEQKWKYNDWDKIVLGAAEPMKGDRTILDIKTKQLRHIVPTEVRRRKKATKEYERTVKRVRDLTQYIQFAKDHPDEFKKK